MKKMTFLRIYAGTVLALMMIFLIHSCSTKKYAPTEQEFQSHYIKQKFNTNYKHAEIKDNWAFTHPKPVVEPEEQSTSVQYEATESITASINETQVTAAPTHRPTLTTRSTIVETKHAETIVPESVELEKREMRMLRKDLKRSVITAKRELRKSAPGDKSWLIAVLLCFFLGPLGIHRFYLGYTTIGIIQLFTAGGCGIWFIIDFIRLLVGDLGPRDGSPMY